MSIQSQITRIQTNVDNTLAAVAAMGGTVAASATSDDMASAVYTIPQGVSNITARNLSVPVSAWAIDSSSEDFPYKAAIVINGVTGDCYPEIVLSHGEAESGMFSPVSKSYDGGVYIWAQFIPDTDFIVPLIICTPNPSSATCGILATDVSIPVSAWAAHSSSERYSYKATVPISGVTSDHYPEISYNHEEAESGDYSPVAESYDGGVYIFANAIPSAAVIVPTIFCTPT